MPVTAESKPNWLSLRFQDFSSKSNTRTVPKDRSNTDPVDYQKSFINSDNCIAVNKRFLEAFQNASLLNDVSFLSRRPLHNLDQRVKIRMLIYLQLLALHDLGKAKDAELDKIQNEVNLTLSHYKNLSIVEYFESMKELNNNPEKEDPEVIRKYKEHLEKLHDFVSTHPQNGELRGELNKLVSEFIPRKSAVPQEKLEDEDGRESLKYFFPRFNLDDVA